MVATETRARPPELAFVAAPPARPFRRDLPGAPFECPILLERARAERLPFEPLVELLQDDCVGVRRAVEAGPRFGQDHYAAHLGDGFAEPIDRGGGARCALRGDL